MTVLGENFTVDKPDETTSQQIGVEKLYIMTNLKRSTNFSHRSHWCGQKVSQGNHF